MSGFSNWDREAYRGRVGEEEAARRRGVIMGGRWGHQLAEQQAPGLHPGEACGDHGRDPGWVSQIEHGEVSTVEALASYIAALSGSSSWSRTSAATCSRCQPTRPPDLCSGGHQPSGFSPDGARITSWQASGPAALRGAGQHCVRADCP